MTPLFITQIHQPKNVALILAKRGHGFTILLGFLAMQWFFVMPLDIASGAMRFTYSLPQGILLLWNRFFRFALEPALFIFILAIILHYLSRVKRFHRHDIACFAALLAYAYFPFLLMLCVGYILGHFGLSYPLGFQPHRSWQEHSAWQEIIHFCFYFGPTSILAFIGAHTLLTHDIETERSTHTTPQPLSILCLTIFCAALIMNCMFIKDNWQKVRPPLPGDQMGPLPGKALDGAILNQSLLEGKVVLIDFWATWCPPCVAAMPHLKTLYDELKNENFALVSINVEPDNIDEVKSFIENQKLRFSVFVDPGKLQEHYRVETLPTMLIYDNSGVLRHIHSGNTSINKLRQEIEALQQIKR